MSSVRTLKQIPRYLAVILMAMTLVVLPGLASPAFADEWPDECSPGSEGTALNQTPWHVQRMNLDLAHPHSRGTFPDGTPVKVAVLDSGVAMDHPAFGGRVIEGADGHSSDAHHGGCDSDGHGTVVAGIIAGGSEEGVRYTGIAPEAEIIAYRTLPAAELVISESDRPLVSLAIEESIDLAVAAGADVINISAGSMHTPGLEAAVERALASDVVIVAAVGNESEFLDQAPSDVPAYPAMYDGVIAVGAIDGSGAWNAMSNYGSAVEIVAPGIDISGPAPGGAGYIHGVNGTSFATPQVSGTVALMRAKFPEMTVDEIRERLFATADPPGGPDNNFYGWGIVNTYRALTDMDPTPLTGDEEGNAVQPQEQTVEQWPRVVDPLRETKMAAAFTLIGSVALIIVVVVLRKLVPVGRSRGWAPGTRKNLDE
ncbi:S8 family peptidase [Natronoglycomyces albus]|uniref:S8 family serine peptidase n=1 Tax=Natronoglycomyces albus TaxID=2811108 RepID=A0A895XU18_9ACTN|nr:S8 family serine peptidase [Natronoglycomyces albus]QSB06016.1 S8 family serine peptidase [Natronoglycomyces albus]